MAPKTVTPALSVIICTHNPRADYLGQTLASLRAQTLPLSEWELLVLDNASSQPVCDRFALDWHPAARHSSEPALGKTNAVLRGIRESHGDLIVLVDDDNVLAPDYLEQAQKIEREWPRLGTWGGSITACYEEPPPEWLKPYECYLSVREVLRDEWFNLTRPDLYGNLPYGAGLCVRRIVAQRYLQSLETDEIRRHLDRKGDSLVSSGDTDLALVGCDLRLGTGLFASLNLTHLIPKWRLTEAYMAKMLREMMYSVAILAGKRGHKMPSTSWGRRLWESMGAWRRGGAREFRFYRAASLGAAMAAREIASSNGQFPSSATR
jgi:glycosyltransferase involved in cell wall biosynthesis